MNIAYVCYWGVNDVLTISSALPTLEYLSSRDDVSKIDFFTFERITENTLINYQLPPKVNLIQVKEGRFSLLSKFYAYRSLLQKMNKEHAVLKYNVTIGRSIFGGIGTYLFWKKNSTNFIVESFEPHVDYMIDTGVWAPNSLKVKILNYYHDKVLTASEKLITVSNNYKKFLVKTSSIDEDKVFVIPCTVDLKKFARSEESRQIVRNELGIEETTILAVYVGKFGGLYYDTEAFDFFRKICTVNPNVRILILTNQDSKQIKSFALDSDFPMGKMIVMEVNHEFVPRYLSASDVALATIKQFPSSLYSSAIKLGEYWANGLPVVITKGVGDDSEIIENENIGSVIDIADDLAIDAVLSKGNKTRIEEVAFKYRRRSLIDEVYEQVL